jgi:DNA polymerase-3 subunit alpha
MPCIVRTYCLYSEFRQAKNGEEEIIYDLDAREELLKDTYGIPFTRTSNAFVPKLADFSRVMPTFCVKRWGKKRTF